MDSNLVIGRMKQLLEEAYPDDPVYEDQLPKDFERPAFLLELSKCEIREVNIALASVTLTVKVTCFAQADEYGACSREELARRMYGVQKLFCGGSMAADDRALKPTAVSGVGGTDFAEVTVVLSYMDGRSGHQEPGADKETMQNYTLNDTRKD